MDDKMHFVVVCGYGCHLNTPLQHYLDRVVQFTSNKPRQVIFCGGATQKLSAPGVTEANLMLNYLSQYISSHRMHKQVFNLIHNKLAITYPGLGLSKRERRKRIARSHHI
ncbi:hypothetical protein KW791_02290 [Candidatus Parcubacteria bacterium]|nr:hypothetical protein [Candidatus Parcubacteria bacterium]